MENVKFKPFAYEKAALALESLEEDIEKIYQREGLKGLLKIPGIGTSFAKKIEEYLKTGKIKYYQQYKERYPINLEEFINIEGLGPKRMKVLFEKLKITSLKQLEEAIKAHKIASLYGFGPKTEKNLLEAIEFAKKSQRRFLLGEILPRVREIYEKLKNLKEVEKISICGSLRRMKETIGDVDILISSKNPEKVMDFFVSLPQVIKIWGKGKTKSSVRMKEGFDVDLRIVPKGSFGAALQYFTGSKEHNIALRKIALSKGLKLSEYGLFKGSKKIAGEKEEDIYEALGLDWIEPELRENRGEIEAAKNHKLPKIIC